MRILLLVLIVIGFVFSGCSQNSTEVVLPQRSPLGADISTFEAPAVNKKDELSAQVVSEAAYRESLGLVEPVGVISLEQALGLALLDNPGLKAYSWQVRAAEAAQLQSSLNPNPEFLVEVEEFGGSGPMRQFDGAETTFAVSQLIEVGGKRKKREQVASLDKKIASWDYESKRVGVFSDVAKAYAGVLSAQQRVDLDGELLRLSEQLVETVSGRVEAGKDAPLDESKAQVVLSNIKILHRQATNDLTFARSQLASLWAGQAKFEKASGKLDMPKSIVSLESIVGFIDDSPEVARWAVEVEKAQAAYELTKALGKQDVTLSGGVKRFSETDTSALVVGLSIPIGVSDRNQGGRREAMYLLAKARQEQRAVKARLETELDGFYNQMANAYAEATELKDNVVPATSSVYEASKTGYTQGKLDYLNVLDSQRMLFHSMSRYVDAQREYHKAKADVERLIGRSITNDE